MGYRIAPQRVKRPPRFENTVSQLQEFFHGSTVNLHFSFAVVSHAPGEGFDAGIKAFGVDGREIEGASQADIAEFGNGSVAGSMVAGLLQARIESGISNDLVDLIESVPVLDFGEQRDSGEMPNAGDGAEQLIIMVEGGLLSQLFQMGFNPFDLVVKETQMCLKGMLSKGIQTPGFQAIAFLLADVQELFAATVSVTELLLSLIWRCIGFRMVHSDEISDETGIQFVGFVTLQATAPQGFDLKRIEQVDGMVLLMEKAGRGVTIAPGGFQSDPHRRIRILTQPILKRGKALRRIGNLMGAARIGQYQGHIQSGFGNIDPQINRVHKTVILNSIHFVRSIQHSDKQSINLVHPSSSLDSETFDTVQSHQR